MMKKLTDVGLALLALGVVMQVLFGSSVPFMPVDLVVIADNKAKKNSTDNETKKN